MLQVIPWVLSRSRYWSQAYCTPRSLWCTRPAAGPRRPTAIRSASATPPALRSSAMPQPTTLRLNRSITTDRYSHPSSVHRYVRSHAHFRSFAADGPDRKWGCDLTYLWTDEGWLYLSVVIDLFSRRVVGWSMSDDLKSAGVAEALGMALGRRRPRPGLLHHSDRGVQYACGAYRELLEKNGIAPSMSRPGNCYDNAVVESFFGTLKTELVHRRRYRTRAEARADVFQWIECWYNRRRRHSSLGYLSPEQFEAQLN